MSNPSMPDLIKIGQSERDPTEYRAKELFTTGVPEEFEVIYFAYTSDHLKIERETHERLNTFRHKKNREFFTCEVSEAIETIKQIAGTNIRYDEKLKTVILKDTKENDGIIEYFFKDGGVRREEEWDKGTLNAVREFYEESGYLKFEEIWKDNTIETFTKYLDEDPLDGVNHGSISLYKEWRDGKIVSIEEFNEIGGSLKKEHDSDEGIKEGLWIEDNLRFRNEVYSKGTYKNGKREGIWRDVYKKSPKRVFREFFVYEEPDYENPILIFEGNYKNGLREGSWFWLRTGLIDNEKLGSVHYEKGEKIKLEFDYDPLSKKIETGEYKNGKRSGEWEEISIKTNVVERGEYVKGLKEGEWFCYHCRTEWFRTKKITEDYTAEDLETINDYVFLREKGNYSNNLREGIWQEYTEDSLRIVFSGNYSKNKKEGLWEETQNDQITWSGRYKNGLKEGNWSLFHENGKLRITENYEKGLRHGVFKKFDDTGQIVTVGAFLKDAKNGVWKQFSWNGQVKERELWNNNKLLEKK